MNKKGTVSPDVILYIPRIIFIMVAALVVLFIIYNFLNINVDTKSTEAFIFMERVTYSENCLSYIDSDTQRVYPGVIDLERFTNITLMECLAHPKNNFIAAKFTLNGHGETIYFNREYYDFWNSLFVSEITGAGGTKKHVLDRVVTVEREGNFVPDVLNITVVMPSG